MRIRVSDGIISPCLLNLIISKNNFSRRITENELQLVAYIAYLSFTFILILDLQNEGWSEKLS